MAGDLTLTIQELYKRHFESGERYRSKLESLIKQFEQSDCVKGEDLNSVCDLRSLRVLRDKDGKFQNMPTFGKAKSKGSLREGRSSKSEPKLDSNQNITTLDSSHALPEAEFEVLKDISHHVASFLADNSSEPSDAETLSSNSTSSYESVYSGDLEDFPGLDPEGSPTHGSPLSNQGRSAEFVEHLHHEVDSFSEEYDEVDGTDDVSDHDLAQPIVRTSEYPTGRLDDKYQGHYEALFNETYIVADSQSPRQENSRLSRKHLRKIRTDHTPFDNAGSRTDEVSNQYCKENWYQYGLSSGYDNSNRKLAQNDQPRCINLSLDDNQRPFPTDSAGQASNDLTPSRRLSFAATRPLENRGTTNTPSDDVNPKEDIRPMSRTPSHCIGRSGGNGLATGTSDGNQRIHTTPSQPTRTPRQQNLVKDAPERNEGIYITQTYRTDSVILDDKMAASVTPSHRQQGRVIPASRNSPALSTGKKSSMVDSGISTLHDDHSELDNVIVEKEVKVLSMKNLKAFDESFTENTSLFNVTEALKSPEQLSQDSANINEKITSWLCKVNTNKNGKAAQVTGNNLQTEETCRRDGRSKGSYINDSKVEFGKVELHKIPFSPGKRKSPIKANIGSFRSPEYEIKRSIERQNSRQLILSPSAQQKTDRPVVKKCVRKLNIAEAFKHLKTCNAGDLLMVEDNSNGENWRQRSGVNRESNRQFGSGKRCIGEIDDRQEKCYQAGGPRSCDSPSSFQLQRKCRRIHSNEDYGDDEANDIDYSRQNGERNKHVPDPQVRYRDTGRGSKQNQREFDPQFILEKDYSDKQGYIQDRLYKSKQSQKPQQQHGKLGYHGASHRERKDGPNHFKDNQQKIDKTQHHNRHKDKQHQYRVMHAERDHSQQGSVKEGNSPYFDNEGRNEQVNLRSSQGHRNMLSLDIIDRRASNDEQFCPMKGSQRHPRYGNREVSSRHDPAPSLVRQEHSLDERSTFIDRPDDQCSDQCRQNDKPGGRYHIDCVNMSHEEHYSSDPEGFDDDSEGPEGLVVAGSAGRDLDVVNQGRTLRDSRSPRQGHGMGGYDNFKDNLEQSLLQSERDVEQFLQSRELHSKRGTRVSSNPRMKYNERRSNDNDNERFVTGVYHKAVSDNPVGQMPGGHQDAHFMSPETRRRNKAEAKENFSSPSVSRDNRNELFSPSVSMAKLKLNTPTSSRRHNAVAFQATPTSPTVRMSSGHGIGRQIDHQLFPKQQRPLSNRKLELKNFVKENDSPATDSVRKSLAYKIHSPLTGPRHEFMGMGVEADHGSEAEESDDYTDLVRRAGYGNNRNENNIPGCDKNVGLCEAGEGFISLDKLSRYDKHIKINQGQFWKMDDDKNICRSSQSRFSGALDFIDDQTSVNTDTDIGDSGIVRSYKQYYNHVLGTDRGHENEKENTRKSLGSLKSGNVQNNMVNESQEPRMRKTLFSTRNPLSHELRNWDNIQSTASSKSINRNPSQFSKPDAGLKQQVKGQGHFRSNCNQGRVYQSTPVKRGCLLQLNETMSTILDSEETEKEEEDEIILIS